jgi:hypothetical protein
VAVWSIAFVHAVRRECLQCWCRWLLLLLLLGLVVPAAQHSVAQPLAAAAGTGFATCVHVLSKIPVNASRRFKMGLKAMPPVAYTTYT